VHTFLYSPTAVLDIAPGVQTPTLCELHFRRNGYVVHDVMMCLGQY
jgi:hypothetical protein